MKSTSKDRIRLSLIVGAFLLVLSVLGYLVIVNPVSATYLSKLKVVDINNEEQINLYKKYKTKYLCKVNENNEFLLEYNYYDNEVNTQTFTLTKEDYNKLVEGEYYWLKVKYADDNETTGTIKEIYKYDPMAK